MRPLEEVPAEDRGTLAGLRLALERAEDDVRALKRAIELVESVTPTRNHHIRVERKRDARAGSIVDQVLKVMQTDPERAWDCWGVSEVLNAVGGLNGQTVDPLNSVRTALGRLYDRGMARRVRKGQYVLTGNGLPAGWPTERPQPPAPTDVEVSIEPAALHAL